MLFKNISVINENFSIDKNRYVVVEGSRITYVGDLMPSEWSGRVIDGKNKLLMSAFFNAHAHSPMTLMRGYGENLNLQDWLNNRIFPFEDKLSSNAVYWGTMLAMAESLKYGIVSTSDMYYFCDDIVRAVTESGAKANIARSITNPAGEDPATLASMDEMKKLYDSYHGFANDRIRIDMSLHAEYTSNRETAEALAGYAKSIKDTIMQIHVSETRSEHEECIKRHGMTPAEYLNDTGLFDVPAIAAHCVYSTDSDLELFAEKGVTVATNPISNMKLASGICDTVNVLKHKVNLAIGTDSVASNNSLNFFQEMKVLLLGSKIASDSPVALSPEQALRAATKGGAEAQGRNDTAVIKEGYKADLIVLDISSPEMHPVHSLVNNIVYSCSGSEVFMTIADGKILYENGEYTTIDLEKTVYETGKAVDDILRKL